MMGLVWAPCASGQVGLFTQKGYGATGPPVAPEGGWSHWGLLNSYNCCCMNGISGQFLQNGNVHWRTTTFCNTVHSPCSFSASFSVWDCSVLELGWLNLCSDPEQLFLCFNGMEWWNVCYHSLSNRVEKCCNLIGQQTGAQRRLVMSDGF